MGILKDRIVNHHCPYLGGSTLGRFKALQKKIALCWFRSHPGELLEQMKHLKLKASMI